MIRNKAVTKLKLAEFYCLKVLEITGNFLEAIAFNAIFGEDYEPRTRDLMREKHLRLAIVGSITLDCRSGQADPMSEAFLQMAGGVQPVGTCHDKKPCAVWYGKRQSQRQANRQTASNRRQHSRNLPSALSRFQKRAVKCFGTRKGL